MLRKTTRRKDKGELENQKWLRNFRFDDDDVNTL